MVKTASSPFYAYGLLYRSDSMQQWIDNADPDFKQYRRDWTERVDNNDYSDSPLNANIEVTSRCNMACTFCYNIKMPDSQIGDLTMSRYKKFIDDGVVAGLKAINLNGLGEPTLRDDLIDMISYAKDKGILEVMFHTNASKMTHVYANTLIDSGLDKIIFSVDSPDRKTYEGMRLLKTYDSNNRMKIVPMDFDQVYANVKCLYDVKQSRASIKPFIRTTMVLTDTNERFVPDFIERWKPFADEISVQDMLSESKITEKTAWRNKQKSRVFENKQSLLDFALKNNIKYICPLLYQSMYFYNNGDIAMCSYPQARDMNIIGNIDNDSVVDIWHSTSINELRATHESGNWHTVEMCKNCDMPYVAIASYLDESHTSAAKKSTT